MAELSKEKFQIVGCEVGEADSIVRPNIGYWADAWRRLKKNQVAMASLIILGVISILCIIGPMLVPYGFNDQNYQMLTQTPTLKHWFGTDELGRDLFVRLWKGGRVSLEIGIVGTLIELVFGSIYGGICGYYGGLIDNILMRFAEIIVSVPYLIVVILLLLVLKPGIPTIILALCITGWVSMARLTRGQVMQLKQSEYILAAQALGASSSRIISKHLIPNTIGIMIVYASMDVPDFIFSEAFLSFLGLGVPLPNTSWGVLVYDGQSQMMNHPYLLIFPAIAISLTMLAFNLLGDGLRDALDPKLRQ